MNSNTNQKIAASGLGLTTLKSKSVNLLPPPISFQNFVQCITTDSIDKSLCDESEIYYIDIWIKENNYGDDLLKYWQLFTLQEKKVIHGLSSNQIAPYIAYRRAFRDGPERYQHLEKPIFILIELASACNIKCPFCFQSDKSFTTKEFMGFMDLDLAKKVIDEADRLKVRGITFASRGEPLLYRHLPEILEHLNSKENIFEIKINTNAKRLTQQSLELILRSKVNIFVVSTDHYKKDMYEYYRKGASYEIFIQNIERINAMRKSVGRSHNFFTRASGVEVDSSMDAQAFSDFYNQFFDEAATIKMSERWDTYNNPIDPDDSRPCGLPFERLYVWYDGTSNPCDTDYKSYLSPGNVADISISQAWDNLNNLRQAMKSGNRQTYTPCDRCYVA